MDQRVSLRGRRVQRWLGGLAVAAAMLSYYAIFYLPPREVGSGDPDRYYHLAISKRMAAEGLIRELPQAEDLGWGAYFPDKEFLFHVLTAGAYRVGGEPAVLALVPVLGTAVVLTLYLVLSSFVLPGVAAANVVSLTLLSSGLIFRLSLLRPHLLAVLFFCLMLGGILKRRPWLIALGAAAFSLSYHAYYVPLAVIALDLLTERLASGKLPPRWYWGLAGAAIGILLNPYFPSTLVMSGQHLKLALGLSVPPGMNAGTELVRLGLREFVDGFGMLPAVLLFAVGARQRDRETGFLFLTTLLFTLLSGLSPRATEYAIPAAILLTGFLCLRIRVAAPVAVLIGLAVAAPQLQSVYAFYQDAGGRAQSGGRENYRAAIAQLPPEADGKKVFNCRWEAGAYLLYFRPEVRFVDLLDPSFLWEFSPRRYLARASLVRGLEPEVHAQLRDLFRASYVLCEEPSLIRILEVDTKHFTPLNTATPGNPVRVFSLIE